MNRPLRRLAPAPRRDANVDPHTQVPPEPSAPQTVGSFQLQIDNYHFTNMGDVVSYILLLPESRRYPVQLFVYSQLMTHREKHDEAIHDLVNYVANQKDWMWVGTSDAEVVATWSDGIK
jgi:hypothetical protein